MIIVYPILERDINHGEAIWNAAIIVGNNGNIIGKHRKVEIESYPFPFASGDEKPQLKDFGNFCGSSHFSAPDASCTPALSGHRDGLLVSNMDLNLCRQLKDKWGFRMTAQYELYADMLYAENLFNRSPCS
ncbi:hypothetical protein NL676_039285 [Syzygium grande]|nr:hypothetical protein NL676_039285 [Syzygium grande]